MTLLVLIVALFLTFCAFVLDSVHVLVIPKRLVLRYADLTTEEITDLWVSSQRYVLLIEGPNRV